jgi:phenylalanyl-tRNA synthetase beta chain
VRAADGPVLGSGGVVAPGAVDAPAWADALVAFEIELPREPAPRAAVRFQALAPFPAVERDLALVVADHLPSERVLGVIQANGGEQLSRVELFDVYRGKGIPQGSRSLAYRLRFQSAERTLTDAEVDRAVGLVVQRLQGELNVQVRG